MPLTITKLQTTNPVEQVRWSEVWGLWVVLAGGIVVGTLSMLLSLRLRRAAARRLGQMDSFASLPESSCDGSAAAPLPRPVRRSRTRWQFSKKLRAAPSLLSAVSEVRQHAQQEQRERAAAAPEWRGKQHHTWPRKQTGAQGSQQQEQPGWLAGANRLTSWHPGSVSNSVDDVEACGRGAWDAQALATSTSTKLEASSVEHGPGSLAAADAAGRSASQGSGTQRGGGWGVSSPPGLASVVEGWEDPRVYGAFAGGQASMPPHSN